MAGDVLNYGNRQAFLQHARYPRMPQIVNLNCVAMIEDLTDERESKAVISTGDGPKLSKQEPPPTLYSNGQDC